MHISPKIALLSCAAAFLAAPAATAQESTNPQPRMTEYDWMSIADWYRRHADDVEIAQRGKAKLLFLGDSITQGWEWTPSYKKAFGEHDPANFGIGGDRTENLLWRLQHGATGALKPEAIVLLIGVNNFGHRDASVGEVYKGVKANLDYLKSAFPEAKILTLGVFPWGEKADSPNREKARKVNQRIAKLEDDQVKVLDVGHIFLEDDGSISKEVMPDFLHPSDEGYRRLTEAVKPVIESWMR